MSNFKNWFKSLFFNFSRVFQRYQAGCFFSALLTFAILVIIWTQAHIDGREDIWGSIAWGSGIATCLAFTFEFACITRGLKLWQRIVGTAVITLVAVGCGLFVYFQLKHPDNHYIYIDCVTIFVTLLCMLIPFIGNRSDNRAWNYHDTFVGSVAIAGVLCGVILLCLYAIMGTISFLFDVTPVKIMASLPALIGIFLFTCTAAALIPTEPTHYDEMPSHPRFIRFLSQYILLPLICVEGIVLYVYGLSILIHWELPKGGIVWLVFSYAIIGSLIWYMLIPAFFSEEKHWIKFFHRGFFISLLPLLFLLFVGLFRRISDYGLTTNRFIVFVISSWFAVVAIIFSIKKLKNVTPLILSLIIIAILSLVGPWSMFSVPEKMQSIRFERLATEYHLLKDGHIVTPDTLLTRDQNRKLSESIDFFLDESRHPEKFAEKYFNIDVENFKESDSYEQRRMLMNMLNGTYIDEWDREHGSEDEVVVVTETVRAFRKEYPSNPINISDFDYAFNYSTNHNEETFNMGGNKIKVYITDSDTCPILHFKVHSRDIAINVADSLNLQVATDNLENSYCYKTMSRHIIRHSDEDVELLLDIEQVDIKFPPESQQSNLDRIDFSGYVRFKGKR